MRTPLPLAAAALVAALATAPAAGQSDDGIPLRSGAPATGRLSRQQAYETYTIQVPPGASRLEIRLAASADADLYVKEGAPMEDWDEATIYANSVEPDEIIVLTPTSHPRLRAGIYYVDVVHGDPQNGRALTFTVTATVTGGGTTPPPPDDDPPPPDDPPADDDPPAEDDPDWPHFSADFSERIRFVANEVRYRTFVMEVGADVAQVELTLRGATADCDLYAHYGANMDSWDVAEHVANGRESDETLVLSRTRVPRLRTGTYYVDVALAGVATTVTFAARYTRGFDGQDEPAFSAGAPEPSNEPDVTGEVHEDALWTLAFEAEGPDYRTYTIFVPKDTRSLLVTATGAQHDVDLYLRYGQPIQSYRNDPDHVANSARPDEQLYVDAASQPPLRQGKYYLDVLRAVQGEAVGPLELTVRFDAERPDPIPATPGPVETLQFGRRVSVVLADTDRKAARYTFDVPPSARRLHVAVLGATRDIDVFLKHGGPVTDYQDPSGYDHKAVSARLNERVTIDARSDPPLRPGTYFLDVASLISEDENIAFTLVVTLDDPPVLQPEDFACPPFQRTGALSPLERAVQATVQISCESGMGSGTCLTPRGLIVTNYHVLEDGEGGELQRTDVFVSFPGDFDEPPVQSFVAEVVEADRELDLVLLRVVRDIHDRRLPANLNLPWLPIGDSDALRLGELLIVAGYPSVGGVESRSSISITRGIVSGFTADPQGQRVWIKTDAQINSGNSGGTALNERFEYVGVPSMKMIEETDNLGFCRPTGVIPDAWRAQIRAELTR